MNLRSATYVITKEVRNRALDDNKYSCEDKGDVTIDTDNDSEPDFDSSDDDEFDLILGRDYTAADDNMKVD